MSTKTLQNKKLNWGELTLYLGAVAIILIFTVLCGTQGKNFLNFQNIQNIIKQSSVIAITAIGMSLVILTGGIDLSVGSVVGFVGIACGLLLKGGMALPLVILVALAIGALVGLINGVTISRGKVPAFITTLGTMQIMRGLALIINSGKPVSGLGKSGVKVLMNHEILGIPVCIYYVFIFYALIILVMNYTKFGRRVYALGGNPNAAKLAGINIKKVETLVYVLGGLFAAVAGIMLLSRLSYADPNAGSGYEMNAIAAVVLGGTSMSGGRGKIGNTLVGALILGTLTCGLQILNISSNFQTVITGLVIIAAVYADKTKDRKAE